MMGERIKNPVVGFGTSGGASIMLAGFSSRQFSTIVSYGLPLRPVSEWVDQAIGFVSDVKKYLFSDTFKSYSDNADSIYSNLAAGYAQ